MHVNQMLRKCNQLTNALGRTILKRGANTTLTIKKPRSNDKVPCENVITRTPSSPFKMSCIRFSNTSTENESIVSEDQQVFIAHILPL